MYLRAKTRFKDGKEHRYWSIVESRRTSRGRAVQRQVLYLGEINDCQRSAWCRALEVFGEDLTPRQVAIFPHDREPPSALDCEIVQVRLGELELIILDSGADAGWPTTCGRSWRSIRSGRRAWRRAVRARAGSTCSRRWSTTSF